jgi:hypothetical protein
MKHKRAAIRCAGDCQKIAAVYFGKVRAIGCGKVRAGCCVCHGLGLQNIAARNGEYSASAQRLHCLKICIPPRVAIPSPKASIALINASRATWICDARALACHVSGKGAAIH